MSWESVFSDGDTVRHEDAHYGCSMTKEDDHGATGPSPAGKHEGTIFRRLLAVLLPARYTAAVQDGLSLDGTIARSLDDLEACLRQGRPLKVGAAIDVGRTTWQGRDVVVKQYKHVGWIHSLRHSLKGSRAQRAWRNGHHLLALGLSTPRPLAFINEYRGLLLWQSYLVTEYMEGRTLHAVLRDEGVPKDHKDRLVDQILGLIEQLQSHGISHGDMKHTNILCDRDRVALTDLDGMRIHTLPWLHGRRGRDTARFVQALAMCKSLTPEQRHRPSTRER
jgi:tRNA A-37 threonylcarbamoyl transferase component Bud32